MTRTPHAVLHPSLITVLFLGLLVCFLPALSQTVRQVGISPANGVHLDSYSLASGETVRLDRPIPFFSCLVNDSLFRSQEARARSEGDSLVFEFRQGLHGSVRPLQGDGRGWKGSLTFRNTAQETLTVANVVPLGEGPDRVYITATGPSTYIYRLSRSALFRPGHGPIGVVLPDNAWEMGFCDVSLPSGQSLVAIARRSGSALADARRFRTMLAPGGSVSYDVYLDAHGGDWHDGLRLMFQDRWLYDLTSFSDSLFQRRDLDWIKHSYLMTLLFGWDEQYYDRFKGRYTMEQVLDRNLRLMGRYDVFMIWPTWPRLGLDQRNQFDMYRDMPGGLAELRRQAGLLHQRGGKYFISYNPWDESTRKEEHIAGMEDLLRKIDGDGVVLDTWGESSREFQAAADRVKPGVILYSEGMAVPKDMPGIVAGRVHDALYMPPPLNMNKFIKPDFAIFRVMQVQEGRLHREAAVCLFNGYGAELNVMRTGRPDWMEEEYRYLGRILKLLRDNSRSFLVRDWVPLIPASSDSVWVNRWPGREKTLYTVYGVRPEGFQGPLFEGPVAADRHYVSLYHHTELETVAVNGKAYVPATVEGFSRAWLSTRREGNVDCIAWLPRLLDVRLDGDSLFVQSPGGGSIVVSAGDPGYDTPSDTLPGGKHALSLLKRFGHYEGKFVVQLFREGDLADERVVTMELGTPRLISRPEPTPRAASAPEGMAEIPAGTYAYVMRQTQEGNPTVPYPGPWTPKELSFERFFMDITPVTNAQYKKFLSATRYVPRDTANYLKHWVRENPPKGEEDHPVVWVCLDDARAYARWAGKRLPSDQEWQYAAQGTDGRLYPWGKEYDSTRCNHSLGRTTPVGAYPSGKSPFGVMDMVGNVWQMMDNVYDNVSYYYQTLRGGSYYNPTSSMWYITGGPWPVDKHQMLLLISPGYDRNATVGFRCVKDAKGSSR